MLKWSQVDFAAGVIHFIPTKTEDSSGIAVDVTITPEIREVLNRIREIDGHERIGRLNVVHSLSNEEYEATAIRTAWNRAAERVGLAHRGYTVKSIRAKAPTDAKRAGYDLYRSTDGSGSQHAYDDQGLSEAKGDTDDKCQTENTGVTDMHQTRASGVFETY
ncbi:site-specific integrase [Pandoraea sputorum]|uniref:hypothetical protein n=1 Tax=Pandoraea sputorum TaxID=93222 RepID=UPI0021E52799|nr:hypothetical protein [Pandoraea sputorum]